MFSRLSELMNKDVINIKDGARLGRTDDIEVNTDKASVSAIVIYGRSRFFGLMGRAEDIVIPWENVDIVGEDTVLVNVEAPKRLPRPRTAAADIFSLFK